MNNLVVRKGQKSLFPSKTYTSHYKANTLSAERVLIARSIGDDIVNSIEMIVDDRIEEDPKLRVLSGLGDDEQLTLVKAEILRKIQAGVKKLTQL